MGVFFFFVLPFLLFLACVFGGDPIMSPLTELESIIGKRLVFLVQRPDYVTVNGVRKHNRHNACVFDTNGPIMSPLTELESIIGEWLMFLVQTADYENVNGVRKHKRQKASVFGTNDPL